MRAPLGASFVVAITVGCGGASAASPRADEALVEAQPSVESDATHVDDEPEPVMAERLWHSPAPAFAFRLSMPYPNGQIESTEVSATGELTTWVTPYPQPEASGRATLRTDWSIWDPVAGEAHLTLGADGNFTTRPSLGTAEVSMRCEALPDARIRCRCDGHVPTYDFTYAVVDDRVTASGIDVAADIATVAPAPTSDAQRLRVLMIVAMSVFHHDDHGDSAHDVDF